MMCNIINCIQKVTNMYLWHNLSRVAFHCSDANTCKWTAFSLSRSVPWLPGCSEFGQKLASECELDATTFTSGSLELLLLLESTSTGSSCELPISALLFPSGTAKADILGFWFLPCVANIWKTWVGCFTWNLHGRCWSSRLKLGGGSCKISAVWIACRPENSFSLGWFL